MEQETITLTHFKEMLGMPREVRIVHIGIDKECDMVEIQYEDPEKTD